MNIHYLLYLGASTYNCGAYGEGSYDSNNCSTSAAGSPDTGFAANLGTPYFIGGTILIVLAVVLAVVLARKRRSQS